MSEFSCLALLALRYLEYMVKQNCHPLFSPNLDVQQKNLPNSAQNPNKEIDVTLQAKQTCCFQALNM